MSLTVSPAKREVSVIETARGPIEVLRTGEGPRVLVVHGGHASCHETFGARALALAGFEVWVPSRPGYGRTPISAGTSAEATADLFAAMLDASSISRVLGVVGISAGGPTALQFAARHGARLDALVLACAVTKVWVDPAEPLYRTMHRLFGRWQWATWWMMRCIGAVAPRLLTRMMLEPLSKIPIDRVMAQLSSGDVREIHAMVRRQSSGRGFLPDLEHRVSSEVIESIATPTLVLHSREDASVPFEHAEHAARLLPHSVLTEAPTLTHLLWIGPGRDAVDTRMVEFLRAQLARD
jgi:pimeloyl-ACP methyl ester carboxylesterase